MQPFAKADRSRLIGWCAGVLALSMVTSACAGGSDVQEPSDPGGDTIVIGSIGWDEDVAVHTLWKSLLKKRGYDVEIRQSNAPSTFAGLANDEIDVFMDAWLPRTHKTMMNRHGDSLAKLGSWYKDGTLEWTVPSYVEGVDSISDLRGRSDMFGGTITGIEPKAGITTISKNKVIPAYELGGNYELHESSSSAMVVALESAIAAKKPIVVTLWHPHVAYTKWDLKDLADPEGALGTGEDLWVLSRQNFAKDAPKVATWLENFQLSHEQLRRLEDLMFNRFPEAPQKAVDTWLSENRDLVAKWIPDSGT